MLGVAAPKRFRLLRSLGEGGMGVVYEAFDEERGARVALKTVRSLTAEALARFKAEFRALQDLHHPNLVSLGELIAEGDQWFFTMEVVDGTDVLTYVRRAPGEIASSSSEDTIPPPSVGFASTKRIPVALLQQEADAEPARFDDGRLRRAFGQLATALAAIHGAGKAHRDIKPSNVRVTPEGRLVVLDFGLVTELDHDQLSTNMHVVGTPEYMAPEQAASKGVGPEADWYSFGVMLFEALTGRVPFTGPPLEVLLAKQRSDAPRPSAIATGVPPDLDELCERLLRFDPSARPTASKVLAAFGVTSMPSASRSQTQALPFVGRSAELDVLRGAFEASRKGATTVIVQGESGVGKSCLVRRFDEALSLSEPDLVVLRGRCYERELVPYKAFDGVVDSLARFLKKMPRDEATKLLPTRPAQLLQVFPVLRRVKPFADVPAPMDAPNMDLLEQRTRAFTALRELLTRLADRRPLVLEIDDIQWADADSLTLLAEVLRPPDPPPLLLVATVRTSDQPAAAETLLQRLASIRADVRVVELSRLSREQGEELATLLLRNAGPSGKATAEAIAGEAAGHPLFIDALVRHARLGDGDVPRAPKLDEALWAQVERLEPLARQLVEVLAVAGAPVLQEVLANAVDAERGAFSKSVAYLRVAHLVSITGGRGTDTIEPYHDKVRAAVLARLGGANKAECHQKLAIALEAMGNADAEALAVHWHGAGEVVRSGRYAEKAGDESASALAFDHAAGLFEMAIEGSQADRARVLALKEKLGDALANAGRGAQAATAFQAAAEHANAAHALDLRRRAADQLLRGGHFDEGLAAAGAVLRSVGMRLPATPLAALFSLFFWRTYLWLRGLDFKERDPGDLTKAELTRADICWSVAFGLSFSDNIRGAAFGSRFLALALGLGEPRRVARALALQVGYVASTGERGQRAAARLIERAGRLAEQSEDPYTIAWVKAATGFAHFLANDYRSALPHLEASQHLYVTRCTGVAWEIDTNQYLIVNAMIWAGQVDRLAELIPKRLHEARERGDRYATVFLRTGVVAVHWLLLDKPEELRRDSREAMQEWPASGYHVEHYLAMYGLLTADLYEGKIDDAEDRLRSHLPLLRRSLLLSVATVRAGVRYFEGMVALAIAETRPERRDRALGLALRSVRRLGRDSGPTATCLGGLLRAAHASVSGASTARIVAPLREAIPVLESIGVLIHAAYAKRLLGLASGGDEGAEMVREANAWLREQGVRDPDKLANCILRGEARFRQPPATE
jgi:serine/threonine protein kinase/tetratricopeptide (TPR) repeat protein